jgi:aminoglycoside phosphotransferase (APT) family kinase protein
MDTTWERIYKIINIDINVANKLYKCFEPQKDVESIELFTSGRSTTNYKIKLKNSDKIFVLRIYPKSDKSWHKEFTIQNMFKNCFPIPEMYYFNEDRMIINYPFSIVQYVNGITLDKYITQENKCIPESLVQNIGEILAFIHQKNFEKEGFLDENLNITDGLPPILLWYDYFLSNRAGSRLGSNITSRISKLLYENQSYLEQMTSRFVFSHGDFRFENMIVKNGKLTGIIDWEGALSAPIYLDIGQFFRYEELTTKKVKNSFIYGYKKNDAFDIVENWDKLSKLMDLANLLCLLDNEEEKTKLFQELKVFVLKTLDIFNQ